MDLQGAGNPGTSSRLIWVALLIFVATRLWILLVPTIEESSAGLYAVMGYEYRAAAVHGQSVYEVHAQRVAAQQEATTRASARPTDPALRMIEYPPLTIALLALPTYLGPPLGDATSITEQHVLATAIAFRWMMAGVDLVTFAALIVLLRRMYPNDPSGQGWRLILYTGAGFVLYHLLYDRFDLAMGCLVVVALAMLVSRVHWSAALAVLAITVNIKLVPVLLAPIFVLGATPLVAFRSVGSMVNAVAVRSLLFLAMCAAIILPFYLRDGSRSLDFLKYHSDRGVQVESLPATVLLLADPTQHLTFTHGAMDLADSQTNRAAAKLSTAITIALALLVSIAAIAWSWRTGHRATYGIPLTLAQAEPITISLFALLMLWAAMTTAKVFSPQYLLWVLPLIVLTPGTRRTRLLIAIGLLLVCCLTTWLFPLHYWSDIVRPQPDFTLLPPSPRGLFHLALRNGLFIVMLGGLLAMIWKRTRSPRPSSLTEASTIERIPPAG